MASECAGWWGGVGEGGYGTGAPATASTSRPAVLSRHWEDLCSSGKAAADAVRGSRLRRLSCLSWDGCVLSVHEVPAAVMGTLLATQPHAFSLPHTPLSFLGMWSAVACMWPVPSCSRAPQTLLATTSHGHRARPGRHGCARKPLLPPMQTAPMGPCPLLATRPGRQRAMGHATETVEPPHLRMPQSPFSRPLARSRTYTCARSLQLFSVSSSNASSRSVLSTRVLLTGHLGTVKNPQGRAMSTGVQDDGRRLSTGPHGETGGLCRRRRQEHPPLAHPHWGAPGLQRGGRWEGKIPQLFPSRSDATPLVQAHEGAAVCLPGSQRSRLFSVLPGTTTPHRGAPRPRPKKRPRAKDWWPTRGWADGTAGWRGHFLTHSAPCTSRPLLFAARGCVCTDEAVAEDDLACGPEAVGRRSQRRASAVRTRGVHPAGQTTPSPLDQRRVWCSWGLVVGDERGFRHTRFFRGSAKDHLGGWCQLEGPRQARPHWLEPCMILRETLGIRRRPNQWAAAMRNGRAPRSQISLPFCE